MKHWWMFRSWKEDGVAQKRWCKTRQIQPSKEGKENECCEAISGKLFQLLKKMFSSPCPFKGFLAPHTCTYQVGRVWLPYHRKNGSYRTIKTGAAHELADFKFSSAWCKEKQPFLLKSQVFEELLWFLFSTSNLTKGKVSFKSLLELPCVLSTKLQSTSTSAQAPRCLTAAHPLSTLKNNWICSTEGLRRSTFIWLPRACLHKPEQWGQRTVSTGKSRICKHQTLSHSIRREN